MGSRIDCGARLLYNDGDGPWLVVCNLPDGHDAHDTAHANGCGFYWRAVGPEAPPQPGEQL
ncbi:MAG: hypothetical protein JWM31_103, partial [Solirubrobacterales bacterium]|nr:hypothetical protein [Solirubrobacterales bacterium]